MSSRRIIHSEQAPKAIGPYSQAVQVGNTLYLSGQTPIDPATGELVPGDIGVQARQVFENLSAVLAAAGVGFDQVVRVGIYLTDLGNFAVVNEVMKQYFREPYPARSTIGVAALPKAAQVEIDLVAVFD
ncbi:RidA family protein [Dokdonella sp.]|uniref:RidA family protein n=1 Tax=Dokdonella sp. TaxID=2291710 RepID=UPI002C3CA2A2|nr:RidA family protein [Dokdonella sp.]HPN78236.1 RidA family protein [Dokdonella sp.]